MNLQLTSHARERVAERQPSEEVLGALNTTPYIARARGDYGQKVWLRVVRVQQGYWVGVEHRRHLITVMFVAQDQDARSWFARRLANPAEAVKLVNAPALRTWQDAITDELRQHWSPCPTVEC